MKSITALAILLLLNFTNIFSQSKLIFDINQSINIVKSEKNFTNYFVGGNISISKPITHKLSWLNSFGISYSNLQFHEFVDNERICLTREISMKKVKTSINTGLNYRIGKISIIGQIGINKRIKQVHNSNNLNETIRFKDDPFFLLSYEIRNPNILLAYRIISGYNFEIKNREFLLGITYSNTPTENNILADHNIGVNLQYHL